MKGLTKEIRDQLPAGSDVIAVRSDPMNRVVHVTLATGIVVQLSMGGNPPLQQLPKGALQGVLPAGSFAQLLGPNLQDIYRTQNRQLQEYETSTKILKEIQDAEEKRRHDEAQQKPPTQEELEELSAGRLAEIIKSRGAVDTWDFNGKPWPECSYCKNDAEVLTRRMDIPATSRPEELRPLCLGCWHAHSKNRFLIT